MARQILVGSGQASGNNCEAKGPGLSTAGVGVPALVAVLIKDNFGNPKTLRDPIETLTVEDGLGLRASLTDRAGESVGTVTVTQASVKTKRHGTEVEKVLPGLYNVIYRAQKPGNFTLSIFLDGEHIRGSPFPVAVKALDVAHEHRVVSDTLLWSSEVKYSWFRDTSGALLREVPPGDIYGSNLLIDELEKEADRAARFAKMRLKKVRPATR